MKIILFANSDWYLYNYRLVFAKFLREQGHEVILISPSGKYSQLLQQEGFSWLPLEFSRDSLNPIKEIRVVWKLSKALREIQPDVLNNFTLKSVLYGSLAARQAKIPRVINAITGRGYLFLNENYVINVVQYFITPIFRHALSGTQVIFQNRDDMDFFLSRRFVATNNTHYIPGSGVDVERFKPDDRDKSEPPIVALCARMLWEKGIKEFVEAAQIIHAHGKKIRMVLVGGVDPGNPSSVPEELLQEWNNKGIVEWWGWQENMLEVYRSSSLV